MMVGRLPARAPHLSAPNPWRRDGWGGYVYIPGGAWRTGGPIVQNSSGQLRMLTAGHRTGALGNYTCRSERNLQTNGPHMGNATQRSWCSNCLDGAVADSGSSGGSYEGGDNGTSYTEKENVAHDGDSGGPWIVPRRTVAGWPK